MFTSPGCVMYHRAVALRNRSNLAGTEGGIGSHGGGGGPDTSGSRLRHSELGMDALSLGFVARPKPIMAAADAMAARIAVIRPR